MSTQESKIITFYSYKGGVGRSMALANVAWLLASKYRKKVLAIDWDLEAPGLHRFFTIQEENIKRGLIDLFYDYKNLLRQDAFSLDEGLVRINRYIVKVPEKTKIGGSILFMPSGKQDKGYAKRVNEFDWQDFYTNWHGFGFIEYLKDQFKMKADIVLIDSRTGVTDTGGICTLQLPDVVALLFTLNEQNIAGTEMIIESIYKKSTKIANQKEQPKLIIVPSRVEKYVEHKRRKEWERKAARRLGEYLPEKEKRNALRYIKKKSIPYEGYFSFGEMLAAKEDPDGDLADVLDYHTDSMLEAAGIRTEEMKVTAEPLSAVRPHWLNLFSIKNLIISIIIITAIIFGTVKSYQRIFKKGPIENSISLIDLGTGFLEIAEDRDNIEDKEGNLNKATQSFNKALDILNVKENPHWYAKAHNGLGNAYRDLAGIRDKEENLTRAIQSFNKALAIFTVKEDPFWYAKTQNDLGNAYRDLSLALNDQGSLIRAIQLYNMALEIFNVKEYPAYHEEVSWNLDAAINMQKAIQKKKPNRMKKK